MEPDDTEEIGIEMVDLFSRLFNHKTKLIFENQEIAKDLEDTIERLDDSLCENKKLKDEAKKLLNGYNVLSGKNHSLKRENDKLKEENKQVHQTDCKSCKSLATLNEDLTAQWHLAEVENESMQEKLNIIEKCMKGES